MSSVEAEMSAQEWELQWWEGCNFITFGEEAKQLTYARMMGMAYEVRDGKWPVYDLQGRSVLDLGGGPVSMLLKTVNGGKLTVVDPCPYPRWVLDRYEHAGITLVVEPAETYTSRGKFDECWIYNCLQHVIDPKAVIETAKRHASVVRIFEWVETEANIGHPHTLHVADLNDWIGSAGWVAHVDDNGATGLAYFGAFLLGGENG